VFPAVTLKVPAARRKPDDRVWGDGKHPRPGEAMLQPGGSIAAASMAAKELL